MGLRETAKGMIPNIYWDAVKGILVYYEVPTAAASILSGAYLWWAGSPMHEEWVHLHAIRKLVLVAATLVFGTSLALLLASAYRKWRAGNPLLAGPSHPVTENNVINESAITAHGSVNIAGRDIVTTAGVHQDRLPDVNLYWDDFAQWKGFRLKNPTSYDAHRVMVIAEHRGRRGTSPQSFDLPTEGTPPKVSIMIRASDTTTAINCQLQDMIEAPSLKDDVTVEIHFYDNNGDGYKRGYKTSFMFGDFVDIVPTTGRMILPKGDQLNFFGMRED